MIEIDDVQRGLEAAGNQAGDFISDEYWKVLDLSTRDELSIDNIWRLVSAERRLNRHLGTTAVELEMAGLVDVYNDVIGQVNEINSAAGRSSQLQPILPDTTQTHVYTSTIIWA